MLGDFFRIDRADFFIDIITLLFVYLMSIPFAGFISAFITNLLGDDTPKAQGFMSLNPINHISAVGLMLLMLVRIGFSKTIEINPSNITGSYRELKLFLAYISEGMGFFILGFISLFILVASYGLIPFLVSSLENLPELSSLDITLISLLSALVYFNFFSAFLNVIWGVFRALLTIGQENGYSYVNYLIPIMTILPVLVIFSLRIKFVAGLIFKFIIFLAILIAQVV